MVWLMIASLGLAKAGGVAAQWPENCLKDKVFPCAIYAAKKTYFEIGQNTFHLQKNTLIEFQNASKAQFTNGVLWFKIKDPFVLQGLHGSVDVEKPSSQVVVDFSPHQSSIKVIEGITRVRPRASADDYVLSPGLSIELGPVDYQRKVASSSFPQVFSLKNYIKSIEKVFPFSEFNFQEHLDFVALALSKGLALQSKWNQTIVERKRTDLEELRVRQKYEAEYQSRRDRYLRSLFRQKNNFEED